MVEETAAATPAKAKKGKDTKSTSHSFTSQQHSHCCHQKPQRTWRFIIASHQEILGRHLQSGLREVGSIHQEVLEKRCR